MPLPVNVPVKSPTTLLFLLEGISTRPSLVYPLPEFLRILSPITFVCSSCQLSGNASAWVISCFALL